MSRQAYSEFDLLVLKWDFPPASAPSVNGCSKFGKFFLRNSAACIDIVHYLFVQYRINFVHLRGASSEYGCLYLGTWVSDRNCSILGSILDASTGCR